MEIDPVSGIRVVSAVGTYADGAEGELLDIMDRASDRSSRSDELASHVHDWPTRYHLSRLRSNIVRPLHLGPEIRILDVGAGTGAIARYLGETGADVIALEESLPRARIALERCRDLTNVEVVCGNVLDFQDDEGFDLIVVVGVLEYAHGAPGAVEAFLGALARLAKLDGAIAIAIENQIGLKYLVGFAEDHLGELLAGVEGYPGRPGVRTYTRQRLAELVAGAGFASQRWLYPFPDYKLPTVVLADVAYESPQPADIIDQMVRSPVQDLHRRRELLTDDRAAHRVFLEAGLGREVANSFLLLAGRKAATLDRLLPGDADAWLFGSERVAMWLRDRAVVGRDSERLVVATDPNRRVRERGWLRQAVPDSQPFVFGRTLEQMALHSCRENDVEAVQDVLGRWRAVIESVAKSEGPVSVGNPFLSAESVAVVPGDYLDANLDNFISSGDGLSFIDAEWEAIGGADLHLVLVRGLWWFAQRLIHSASPHPWSAAVTPDELTVMLGRLCDVPISSDDLVRWRSAEAEFQSMVQGRDLGKALAHLQTLGARSRSDISGSRRLPFSSLRRDLAKLQVEVTQERESLSLKERRLNEAESRVSDLLARLESSVERAREAEQSHDAATRKSRELAESNERLRQEIRDRVSLMQSERRMESEKARVALDAQTQRIRQVEEAARRDHREAKKTIVALKAERDRLARSYERLRNRRIVRFGLGFARVARPLFSFRRRKRTKTLPKKPKAGVDSAASGPSRPADNRDGLAIREVLIPEPLLASHARLEAVSIVIPIFNAYEAVADCIEAVMRNTYAPARLLLIDDASTDDRIGPLLDRYAQRPNVKVLQNPENLGFVGTVNRGFAESLGDVVLLNSDANVTPRWLTRLQLAARRLPKVATVTAVSDSAGAFSVPEPGANSFPVALTQDQIGRAMASYGSRQLATGPTGNAFCMLVRRRALDEIGGFDADAFPRGYGEENDFCMRALRRGWQHAIDGTTLVFHENAASFGDAKAGLVASARKVIDDRYPEYTSLVRSMMRSPELTAVRSTARHVLDKVAGGELSVRPRLLYVLHAAGGGTPATNRDLMAALEDRYDSFVLTSNGSKLVLRHVVDGKEVDVASWVLEPPISVLDETRRDYRQILASVIGGLSIELIHVRHLIGHTFDIGSVARSLGVPVVLSFHDFYFSCPTVHLLDETDTFCGGACTPGQGDCRIPTPWLEPLPHLKHDWINVWRRRVRALMADVDAFVTASGSARSTYLTTYPELAERRFVAIEHGRDLELRPVPAGMPPAPEGPIRIVVPGNLAVHKGSELIRAIERCDEDGKLEFHFLGDVPEDMRDLGVIHGSYERDDFGDRIAEIQPAFVAVFTIVGETYSHIITEAWAAGVPLLVTALGAQQERIERHGGGWVVDHTDPLSAYHTIRAAAADPDEYERRRTLGMEAVDRTVSDMATDYAALYEEVWHSRRPFAVPKDVRPQDTEVARVGLFVVGGGGGHPGSVHVRTLRRWMHPDIQRNVVPRVVDAARWINDPQSMPIDLAVVQRTGIDPELTHDFLEQCATRSIPVIFDLDDDLLSIPEGSPSREAYARYQDSLRELAARAALVTVSTEPLVQRMADFNERAVVVPNQLDEGLWMHPLLPARTGDGVFELLYFGTDTHVADLALLREALEELTGRIRLNVIGGAPANAEDSWYRRIEVPSGFSSYPRFASWLSGMRSEFDAGVIPLVDDQFNRAKSDLKFLEMAALGLPVLASEVSPYADTIRNGETGILVPNTSAAWRAALEAISVDGPRRAVLRRAAYDYVSTERRLGDSVRAYLDLIWASIQPATVK